MATTGSHPGADPAPDAAANSGSHTGPEHLHRPRLRQQWDVEPRGDWVGNYGASGYALLAWNNQTDVVSMPAANLVLDQGSRFRWSANTGDTRALENQAQTQRRAAQWFHSSSLRLHLTFNTDYVGTLHLYAIDWDGTSRRETVDSVCPYCGVGCQLTYNIKDNKILYVQGKDGPANSSRLCVKGRYGFDYVQHKHRLTKPLIRKPGVPKHKDFTVDPENWHEVFREATWEEALDFAAKGLRDIRDTYGKRALAGFGSAKGTNEEAYLFQKLVRTGFGSNNVDHCTRLCHASSVAALMEGINSGAVSNQVRDVANAEVIFVIGANPTVNHPVAATFIKNAAKAGAKLIVADPAPQRSGAPCHLLPAVQRRTPTSRCSTRCSTSSSRKASSTRRSSATARRATRRSPRT